MTAPNNLPSLIDTVKALDAKATKAPWYTAKDRQHESGVTRPFLDLWSRVCCDPASASVAGRTDGQSDAELIAYYRTAAPRLALEVERLEKENAILKLAVPLEEDLYSRIDETCKHLATQQGFTLDGIALLLIECQKRMAADWEEVGRARRDLSRLTQENARLTGEREVYRFNGIREEERANKLLAEVSRLSARLQENERLRAFIKAMADRETCGEGPCDTYSALICIHDQTDKDTLSARQFLAAHETTP